MKRSLVHKSRVHKRSGKKSRSGRKSLRKKSRKSLRKKSRKSSRGCKRSGKKSRRGRKSSRVHKRSGKKSRRGRKSARGHKSRRKYKNNSNQVTVRPVRESCTRMYTDRDKLIRYNNKDKLQGCSFGNCMYTDAMGKEHCASTVAKKYKNTPFSGECKLNNSVRCGLGL